MIIVATNSGSKKVGRSFHPETLPIANPVTSRLPMTGLDILQDKEGGLDRDSS